MKIPQLTASEARLDNALKLGHVKVGTRFLYTINGTGPCYEGTLLEVSPEGHVKLNNSGKWDYPPEVRIEEILALEPPPVPRSAFPVPSFDPPFATTKTTKSKAK